MIDAAKRQDSAGYVSVRARGLAEVATKLAQAMASRNRSAASLGAIRDALYAGTATNAQVQTALALFLEIFDASDKTATEIGLAEKGT